MEGMPIVEQGVTTLIATGDVITASQYSASATMTLNVGFTSTGGSGTKRTHSGEILTVCLYSSGGSIEIPACKVIFFDADPAVPAAAAAITAAEHQTIIGFATIGTTDWIKDGNGATAYKMTALPFHNAHTLYVSILIDAGEATVGSGEIITGNFWYRRDK